MKLQIFFCVEITIELYNFTWIKAKKKSFVNLYNSYYMYANCNKDSARKNARTHVSVKEIITVLAKVMRQQSDEELRVSYMEDLCKFLIRFASHPLHFRGRYPVLH